MSEDMNRVVFRMERIREEMEECESASELGKLRREYGALSAELHRSISDRTAASDRSPLATKTGSTR